MVRPSASTWPHRARAALPLRAEAVALVLEDAVDEILRPQNRSVAEVAHPAAQYLPPGELSLVRDHFLHALLADAAFHPLAVRRMPGLVSGSVDELKRMILGGVEMVLRPEGGGEAKAQPNRYQQTLLACAENSVSGWLRVALGEGIEIHLSDKQPKMTPEQRRQMLKRIEELVKELYG